MYTYIKQLGKHLTWINFLNSNCVYDFAKQQGLSIQILLKIYCYLLAMTLKTELRGFFNDLKFTGEI